MIPCAVLDTMPITDLTQFLINSRTRWLSRTVLNFNVQKAGQAGPNGRRSKGRRLCIDEIIPAAKCQVRSYPQPQPVIIDLG